MMWKLFLRDPRLFAPADDAGGGTPPADPPAQGGDTPPADPPAQGSGTPPADPPAQGGDGDPYAWLSGYDLSDDDRTYLESKKFKTPGDLYKSLRGAEKLIRGDQIQGPPEDPEKLGEWMKDTGLAKRLGIPDAPDGYGIEPPKFDEAVQGVVSYDDARHGRVLEGLHKANLTPQQVSAVLDLYRSEITQDATAAAAAAQADETEANAALKRDWGDQYETRTNAALEAAREFGIDTAQAEYLRRGGIGSTAMFKMLAELAELRGNDDLAGGAGSGLGRMTPEQARGEVQAFMAKNAKALRDRNHPEHSLKLDELQALRKRAGIGSAGRS